MKQRLTIGTRASQLALWQAHHVQGLIQDTFSIPVDIKKISTKGDQIQDRSLIEIGGKGLFLKEIEEALMAGEVDLAVHSLKDVPYELSEGLCLPAILERENPHDAFISNAYKNFEDLPAQAVVGTTSLRRKFQLQAKRPDLEFRDLRGNVDTRLKKLDAGEYDAIVLACAGLIRLGLDKRIAQHLDIVPAVGQGAVAIECKDSEQELCSLLSQLNHEQTEHAVGCERFFLEQLQGDCKTPIGCHVSFQDGSSKDFRAKIFYAPSAGHQSITKTISGLWSERHNLLSKQNITKLFE